MNLTHKIVVGLGFGDEGKGTIVDALCARDDYKYVVRFSGGPQAAHNVVLDDGTHHTFAQFGSGTFSGTPTILSRFMMVNPFNLAKEGEALAEKIDRDPFESLYISEDSLLITPWHVAINQLEEIRRGDDRHGSCGQGIGVAQKFALDYPDLAFRMKDLKLDWGSFKAKALIVQTLLRAEYGVMSKEEVKKLSPETRNSFRFPPGSMYGMYEYFLKDTNLNILPEEEIKNMISSGPCVFEGSQGVLLDEWKGFHPYTTWSTTTPENALTLLSEAGVDREDIEVVGVTRTYHTRHGAGPFPTERFGEHAGGLMDREVHNAWGEFQGGWRVGDLDWSLLEYSGNVVGRIDAIAVTHMDVNSIDTAMSFEGTYEGMVDVFEKAYMESQNLEVQSEITEYLESLNPHNFWYDCGLFPAQILYGFELLLNAQVLIESHGPERGKKVFRGRYSVSERDLDRSTKE